MSKGKQTCKILKEIRRQIAAENDIQLVIEECTYKGDCLGTCPKCEEEVLYLERELEKRQHMGKVAVLGGKSLQDTIKASSEDKHHHRRLLGRVKPMSNPDEDLDPDETLPDNTDFDDDLDALVGDISIDEES